MNYEKIIAELRASDWRLAPQFLPSRSELEGAMRGEIENEMHYLLGTNPGAFERGEIEVKKYLDGGEWTIAEFEQVFRDFIASVPDEFRETAVVDLTTYVDGDEPSSFTVSYVRPETDDEWAARLARAWAQERARQAEEFETFRRLSRKFGPPAPDDKVDA